jgi:hypothetical protein
MTTARNLLYAELTKALAIKSTEPVRERILTTLEKYRVQMKPGIALEEGMTARETLFREVMEKCTMASASEIPRRLQSVFERYRMQSKQKGTRSSKEESMGDAFDDARSTLGSKDHSNGVTKGKAAIRTEPLGGGPVKRSKARGECPKCHSRGVVLAHSYAGDDYFSCIYCGFQAFRAAIETDLDLPLAAELLGRRFDEKTEVESEDVSE